MSLWQPANLVRLEVKVHHILLVQVVKPSSYVLQEQMEVVHREVAILNQYIRQCSPTG